jgi:hypothetical protein
MASVLVAIAALAGVALVYKLATAGPNRHLTGPLTPTPTLTNKSSFTCSLMMRPELMRMASQISSASNVGAVRSYETD